MRLTIILLTAAFAHTYATGNAQIVSISGKKLSLEQVFTVVKKQTGYVVFSNKRDLTETKTVNIAVSNLPLKELLDLVMKDQPLEYTIKDKTIILSRKMATDDGSKPLIKSTPTIELFAPPVTGRVIGADGVPLSGATISIKSSTRGTSTLASGFFSLEVKEGDILEISSIGYSTVWISYMGGQFKLIPGNTNKKAAPSTGKLFQEQNTFTIQLTRSHNPLDEVQVTAYGKTTKRLATGSISTVTAEEIERQPVMTALEALIGKVPGAVVRQVSGNSAAPMQVTLRGRNSINPKAIADPLYVIDGIPQTTLNVSTFTGGQPFNTGAVQAGLTNTLGENPLLRINPRDIERIDVLKDADATAIYGSRGSNGAIIITTKKGKVGPASLSIDIDQGIKMLERYPNLMSTPEYLGVRREAFRNEGTAPNKDNAPDLTLWDNTKYTNWQRLFVGTGSVTAVRASLSGGMGATNYGLSANYNTTKEIMNNGGKNKVGSFNFNFGYASPNQKLRFNFTSRLGISEVNAVAIGDYGSLAPNAPDIYTADGQFNFVPYRISTGSLFPFGSLRKTSQSNTTNLSNNVNLEYELLKGLSFSVTGGYDFTQNSNVSKSPGSAQDPAYPPINSSAYFGKSTNKNWTIRSQASYRTNIGRGKLDVNVIANMQSVTTHGETIIATNFPNEASMKSYLNAQNKDLQQGYGENKYVSASGIIKYNWDNKYVINFSGTRDGSSRFAPGKQFGNFGSVGLRWNASDEKWLSYLLPAWLNYLGFSGSYGITGGDAGSDYEYLSRWAQSVSGTNTLYSYNGVLGFQVVSPLNQEFHWESNRKANIAVNMGFLNNKISVDLQLYRNVASNQLAKMPTPKFTGFSNALINSPATVENKGIEGSIRATLIETKDWGLSFDFNIGANRNTVIAFPDLESSSYKDQIRIGASTSSLMALRYMGIDPMTGNYTFEDHNKDGKVYSDGTIFPNTTVDDRYILIDLTPKYSGGFGFNLNYKSVSLYTSFYFINKLRQDPYLTAIPGSQNNMELPDEIKNNHWKQPGDRVKYPRYVNDAGLLGPINMSDAYYVNGSYLRLTNLAIQWQLPDAWIKKVKVKGARFSLRTQNLFTLSQFRGLDPEVGSSAYQTPIPRTIATNLSFNF